MMSQEINIVVKNEFYSEELDHNIINLLFGPLKEDEGIIFVGPETTIPDLLVRFEFFKSKGDVKRNWNKTGATIPPGFSDFVIGKLRRRLTIWNPIESAEPIGCKKVLKVESSEVQ